MIDICWVVGLPPADLPVTQVYGWCFTTDGALIVLEDDGDYTLPGGTPEAGETFAKTVRREAREEGQPSWVHSTPSGTGGSSTILPSSAAACMPRFALSPWLRGSCRQPWTPRRVAGTVAWPSPRKRRCASSPGATMAPANRPPHADVLPRCSALEPRHGE
jgi:hypothetical protein